MSEHITRLTNEPTPFSGENPELAFADFFPLPLSPSDRERATRMYRWSLNRGDRLTCAALSALSRHDEALERQLQRVHTEWTSGHSRLELPDSEIEAALLSDAEDAELGAIFDECLAEETAKKSAERPLLVGDVAAKVQSDLAQGLVSVPETDRGALQKLRASALPLPGKTTPKNIAKLLGDLGVNVSQSFEATFREAAQFMGLGRGHNRAVLAATRRQSADKSGAAPVELPDAHADAHEEMESHHE